MFCSMNLLCAEHILLYQSIFSQVLTSKYIQWIARAEHVLQYKSMISKLSIELIEQCMFCSLNILCAVQTLHSQTNWFITSWYQNIYSGLLEQSMFCSKYSLWLFSWCYFCYSELSRACSAHNKFISTQKVTEYIYEYSVAFRVVLFLLLWIEQNMFCSHQIYLANMNWEEHVLLIAIYLHPKSHRVYIQGWPQKFVHIYLILLG